MAKKKRPSIQDLAEDALEGLQNLLVAQQMVKQFQQMKDNEELFVRREDGELIFGIRKIK